MLAQLALAAALFSASAALVAQDQFSTTERLDAFRQLDANGDGWLSSGEAAKRPEVRADFRKADANRDGRLSFAEFESIALRRSGSRPRAS